MIRPLHSGMCKTCGVPFIWAKDSLLDGDNTSIQKMVPVRGVFYEVDEIQNFVESLEGSVGVPLSALTFEAHKRAIRRFFEGTLEGLTGEMARILLPGFIYRQQTKVTPYFGVGKMRMVSYQRGGPLVVEAEDVWNENLFSADVAGSFEAIEGGESDADYDTSGGVFRVVAHKRSREKEELRGRLVPITGQLMGTPQYPRCPDCGSPVSFQAFSWDYSRGVVLERESGIRLVHQTIGCFDALLQEMESELGDRVRELAVRAEADFVRERIESGAYPAGDARDPERLLFEHLGLMRKRCFGNPILIEMAGNELTVHVRNPANVELLIGRTLGTYEAVLGLEGAAAAESREGMLKVVAAPR